MPRLILTLLALLVAGAAVFFAGHRLAESIGTRHFARPIDDLDWLRLEFGLGDAELARIRRLHEAYLPVCRDYCERIDARNRELQAALSSPSGGGALVDQKLLEIGTLRAQCQAAMLRHFREVSDVMPAEPGRRYLGEMQRLTLRGHEEIERSMSRGAPEPHGHR